MRGMAAATGMDMDTSGSGQSVVAHHPQWGGGGGGGGPVGGPPPPPGPPHGARPVPHPPGLQPPGVGPVAATVASASSAAAAAVASSLHQNGSGGIPPPMENSVVSASPVQAAAAAVPHNYSSPATLSYTREEGRGEHWAAPPPARLQVTARGYIAINLITDKRTTLILPVSCPLCAKNSSGVILDFLPVGNYLILNKGKLGWTKC